MSKKVVEKNNCAAMPNICQNKQWWKVHSYKRLISIFEDDASELLFGLELNSIEIQEQKGGGGIISGLKTKNRRKKIGSK